jgi:hypothetical protein
MVIQHSVTLTRRTGDLFGEANIRDAIDQLSVLQPIESRP